MTVDFAAYIAKKMGVKLELKSVTSATRIPQLWPATLTSSPRP